MLEIKDLAVQYGNQAPTIEHFNLSMKKGEIISVVGESGSGKTTVIRAVLGALSGAGRDERFRPAVKNKGYDSVRFCRRGHKPQS